MRLPPTADRVAQAVLAPRGRSRLAEEVRALCPRHRANARILDVGCGQRTLLDAVGIRPTGVDVDARALRVFDRRGGRGVLADATSLPFDDACFDSVWSFGLLHHLDDERALRAVREMRRVTVTGGSVVVFDAVRAAAADTVAARLVRGLDRGHWLRPREATEALLRQAGDWQIETVRYSVWGLRAVIATGCRT